MLLAFGAGIGVGILICVYWQKLNRYLDRRWSWGPGEF